MTSKMSKLALAVALGVGGLSQLPPAHAMNLAADGLGQVLIFPYYTVQGGWTTLFNLTNTSDQILAIKIRFHESYNSRDVLDFNVIMSPNDVWNGWVALDSASGGPAFFTEDKTCTTLNANAYSGVDLAKDGLPFYDPTLGIDGTISYTNGSGGNNADGGPTTVARMNEGYIEAILMASSRVPAASGVTANPLVRGALHVNGVPTGCNALANAFSNIPQFNTLFDGTQYFTGWGLGVSPTSYGFTRPAQWNAANTAMVNSLNPLKGSYNLVNGTKGWTAAGTPTTIADFVTASNLLTSMIAPVSVPFGISFLEPSLNSADNNVTDTQAGSNAAMPGAQSFVPGVNVTSALLARTHVINQWTHITSTSTSAWTTATDWVVTFPTKSFYVDNWPASLYSARTADRNVGGAAVGVWYPGGAANDIMTVRRPVPWGLGAYPSPFNTVFDDSTLAAPANLPGQSCQPITVSVYNREETPLANGVSPGGATLCYESNVITFGLPTVAANNILSAANPKGLPNLIGENGYLDMTFAAANTANVAQGLPVISFAITSRDTGNGVLNEAFLIDAAYSRKLPPLNP